ncbi:acyl-CoA dehydrogenase family protein [Streptomyces dysideae]|uniref:Acyl-CoA dehydrogenase n=1 Tax=Streptomyces dysideae TaxID=909626 RepID=A0A101V503_9ACTN|nr:acyl-CoA dehydrogenase family protein [Streptomyces dysideae]KUO22598.1 acyl-CoA dehydrogenase [Streptomyces dysideae]
MTVQPLARPRPPGSEPAPDFRTALTGGQLDWDAWCDLPEPGPAERLAGDEAVTRTLAFLATRIDPDAIDRTGELPAGLIAELQDLGAFRLGAAKDLGGLGLTPYNVFRVVEATASRSVAVGFMLGVHNGIGVGTSLLPVLPDGPLRDLVRRRTAEGLISGFADTEPAGQNNQWPTVTATPTPDGSAYTLSGEKLFVSNGPVADLLGVTVTVREAGGTRVGLAVVDTRDPAFTVPAAQEFLGVRGSPNGWLRLDGVRVPREHLVTVPQGDPRTTPRLASAVMTARMLIQAAPALAIARNCLAWSREFVTRRRINGIALGEYDLARRTLAATAADVHAMDSVVRWSLGAADPEDRFLERNLARNICTDACARVVDRTVSLLGGEGLETARSKRDRGALPVPLERAYRDARVLRTAGAVDFLADLQTGRALVARPAGGARPEETAVLRRPRTGALSPRNCRHLHALFADLRRFDITRRAVGDALAEEREPHTRQYAQVLLGRIARELFAMAAVLARTARDGDRELTDVHCTAARFRLHGLWARLDAPSEPDYAAIGHAVLAGDRHLDDLLRN